MNWTQPVCTMCWNEYHRDDQRDAPESHGGPWAQCCQCGGWTDSGIFVRVNPRTVPFPVR